MPSVVNQIIHGNCIEIRATPYDMKGGAYNTICMQIVYY